MQFLRLWITPLIMWPNLPLTSVSLAYTSSRIKLGTHLYAMVLVLWLICPCLLSAWNTSHLQRFHANATASQETSRIILSQTPFFLSLNTLNASAPQQACTEISTGQKYQNVFSKFHLYKQCSNNMHRFPQDKNIEMCLVSITFINNVAITFCTYLDTHMLIIFFLGINSNK